VFLVAKTTEIAMTLEAMQNALITSDWMTLSALEISEQGSKL